MTIESNAKVGRRGSLVTSALAAAGAGAASGIDAAWKRVVEKEACYRFVIDMNA